MFTDRLSLYQQLESKRKSKLLVYATSSRVGMETQIAPEILSKFTEHLDIIKKADKISLFLITNGGHTLTAWNLVNLIRGFCKEFEVIVPFNCYSSGTIICLGADNIVMTKQATLGPIDPSVNGPLNPIVPGTNVNYPVSVEFVNAYMEMAKKEFGITDQKYLSDIYLKLSDLIHPMVIGQVYRSRNQIQMLARNLMSLHGVSNDKQDKIVRFLCSESGSHDYSIHRKEAIEKLELDVEKPDEELYAIIKQIYKDISSEMQLDNPFNPTLLLGSRGNVPFSCRRSLIESVDGQTDVFLTEGQLNLVAGPPATISNTITKDNWEHENH